jgi:hypothetical protein
LGGGPRIEALVREVGLAEGTSTSLPADASADLVVLLGNASVDIRTAIRSLAPGGALYCELQSNRRAVRDAVLRAGLESVEVYGRPSGAGHQQVLLPFGNARVIDWCARSPDNARGLRTAGAVTLLRVAARCRAPTYGPLMPASAIRARKPTSDGARPSLLERMAGELGWPGSKVQTVMFTPGVRDSSGVILLPFLLGAGDPAVAIKTRRLREQERDLSREQDNLREARAEVQPSLRETLPQPLGIIKHEGVSATVQTYCPGRSLAASTAEWYANTAHKTGDLALAATWLTDFHRQTLVGRPAWTADEAGQWLEKPLELYCQTFGLRAAEEGLFAEARRRSQSLSGIPLPIVRQHNDFDPWNIKRFGRRIFVLDWERSCAGPALMDLLHFVSTWSYLARGLPAGVEQTEGFVELFVTGGKADEIVRAVRSSIAGYMEQLQVDSRFLPLLLVMTLVERALDRERTPGGTVARPANRPANRQVRYLEALAPHAARLFSVTASR